MKNNSLSFIVKVKKEKNFSFVNKNTRSKIDISLSEGEAATMAANGSIHQST